MIKPIQRRGWLYIRNEPRPGDFFLFGGYSLSVCLSVYQSPCRCQYRTRWRSLSPAQIKITSDFYFIEQSCFIEQMADGVLSVEVIVSLDLGD